MRFRLRTLLIVLALGPMVLAGGYFAWVHNFPFAVQIAPADIGPDGFIRDVAKRFHPRPRSPELDLLLADADATQDSGDKR